MRSIVYTLSIGNNGTVATVYNIGEIKENVPSSAKIIAVMSSKALDETFSNSSISQPTQKSNSFDEKLLIDRMQSNMRLVWMRIIAAENLLPSKLNTLKTAKQEANAVGIPTQNARYRLRRYANQRTCGASA